MTAVNVALDSFALAITELLLICRISQHVRGRYQRLLVAMLLVNTAVLCSDLFTWLFEGQAEYTGALYFANFLVFSLGYVMAALFTDYLICCIYQKFLSIKANILILVLPCAFAVLLTAISLFNGMYFSFIDGVYTRGPLFWLSQVYGGGVMLFDTILIVKYRKMTGTRYTFALLTYILFPLTALLIQIFRYGVTLLYLASTMALLCIYIVTYTEQEHQLHKTEQKLIEARTSVMLSQIQPHFISNSLSAIMRLCDLSPQQAKDSIAMFSVYLRTNIDFLAAEGPISFEQELQHVRAYLSLEEMRFGEKLKVTYSLQTLVFRLPALTVQPMVENAVKYGIGKRAEGGSVKIASGEDAEHYWITVSDDGVGFREDSADPADGRRHIGIENVRFRLATMVGGRLEIKSSEGAGTTVSITIPKKQKALYPPLISKFLQKDS